MASTSPRSTLFPSALRISRSSPGVRRHGGLHEAEVDSHLAEVAFDLAEITLDLNQLAVDSLEPLGHLPAEPAELLADLLAVSVERLAEDPELATQLLQHDDESPRVIGRGNGGTLLATSHHQLLCYAVATTGRQWPWATSGRAGGVPDRGRAKARACEAPPRREEDGVELLEFYKKLLIDLGSKGSGRVQAIFANASTSFRQPRHLRTVVDSIDALDWYSAKSEGLGDLYEGLLEKNAEETKSGAGQYFTPRPLIESMVALVKPQPGERVQDPAVGTGGFLINADRYVKSQTNDNYDLSAAKQNFQKREAFYGVELVPDVQRLALMNAMLHDIEGDIVLRETLGPPARSCRRPTSSSRTRRSARRRAAAGRRATTSPTRRATSSSCSCSTSTGG